jgi:tape measure domain-containing protein
MSNTLVGGSIVWNLDVDDSKLKSGLDGARSNVESAAKSMQSSGDNASSGIEKIKASFEKAEGASKAFAATIAVVGTAIGGAIVSAVKFTANMETMTQGFVTLLGSTEKADAAIAMIKKDAASTPFEIAGLTNANQLLTSVTKDAGQSERLLLNVGKALTAMGKGQPELDRIVVNLQQIGAVGKASMIDIKQFAFAGIPIFDMLKKELSETKTSITDNSKEITKNSDKLADLQEKLKVAKLQQSEFTDKIKENQIQNYTEQIAALTGKNNGLIASNGKLASSQDSLDDAISNGKVTFELLENMFNKAGEGSGQFSKAFETQAGTMNQVWSNFKDNIAITGSELVKELGIFDAAKEALTKLTEAIGQMATPEGIAKITQFLTTLKTFLPIIAGIIIGGLVPAFAAWATAMIPLLPFLAIGAAIGAVIMGVIAIVKNWDKIMLALKTTLINVGNAIGGFFTSVSQWFGNLFTKIGDFFVNVGKSISDFFKSIPKAVSSFLKTVGDIFLDGLKFYLSIYTYWIPYIIGYILETLWLLPGKIWDILTTVWNNFTKAINNLWDYLKVEIPRLVDSIGNWFKELPGKIWNTLTTIWNDIKTWGVNTWNYFSTEIPKWINNIINWFKSLPGKIKDALSTMSSNVKNTFSDAWTNLTNEIKQWPSRIWDWGRNIANSFVEGFKNALKSIASAFTDGINSAKKNMEGNSPPKEGPLKNIDKWGANIGQAWVDGFANSIGSIGTMFDSSMVQLQSLLSSASFSVDSATSGGGNTQNITIQSVNVKDQSDIDALMRAIGFKLTTV